MIWPQQYHKEKQGSRWPEEGSIDVTFRSSQPVEAPGEQPRCTCAHYHVAGRIGEDWTQRGIFHQVVCPLFSVEMALPAPQPEAPAAEQWHYDRGLDWFVRGTEVLGPNGAAELLNAQQRVLDVNPESPTDATRGVGETEQWRVEQFETGASMITGEMQYGLTDGSYHLFLGTTRKEMAKQHARYLNSLMPRGVGDDPIPQRECEHKIWLTYPGWANVRLCEACPAIKFAGSNLVYLPQPIDQGARQDERECASLDGWLFGSRAGGLRTGRPAALLGVARRYGGHPQLP